MSAHDPLSARPSLLSDAENERYVCPNEWKVRGYIRSSHSMFHPALHECGRVSGHRGRCRCRFCSRETANPYLAGESLNGRPGNPASRS